MAEGPLWISALVYVSLLVIAVVCMPVTVMPLIPIATVVLGPFYTALLSIIGWSVGGAIAFLVSRHLGRPFLKTWLPLKKLDDVVANLPTRTQFWGIFLLRMTIPVDIASYALGLVKEVKFSVYLAATVGGVSIFSFIFAYGGDALLSGNLPVVIELVALSVFLIATSSYLLSRQRDRNRN